MVRKRGYFSTREDTSGKLPRPSLAAPLCKALCVYNRDLCLRNGCTRNTSMVGYIPPQQLEEWLWNEHGVEVSRWQIWLVLKHSHEFLPKLVQFEYGEESEPESDYESEDMENKQGDVGSGLVTLSDSDVLDCPICFNSLTVPVYQCENGHVVCSSCRSKIRGRCPSCSLPIGQSRCRSIEKVLEAASISCPNQKYGCKEMLKYINKNEHEEICIYSPCECPHPSCDFVSLSSKLYSHFSRCHGFPTEKFSFDQYNPVTLERGQKSLILGAKGKNIFILKNITAADGSAAIKVVRIAPPNSPEFLYDVRARYDDAFMKLNYFGESITKWRADDHPDLKYILVPPHLMSASGQLHLELCIHAKPKWKPNLV